MTQANPESRRALWGGALLALAVILAYANSLRGPFVFDDGPSIVDNATIRRLGTAFSPPGGGGLTVEGRPLLNVSLALNYAWGGLDVRSYHVTNLAIHVLAALTLFGLVRRTLPRISAAFDESATGIALAAALLWALHPLQTESVTYVVQRTESLMGLLYLLTLYAFARGWFGVAIVACFLGMATKEVMVSAPLMVLLYDRAFVSGTFRAAWRRHRGFYLGLASSWLLLAYLVAGSGLRGGTIGAGAGVTWWQYALCQARALVHYGQLSLWPSPLVFDYGADFVSFGEALPFALVDLALLGATAWALVRRPALGFLGVWFFAILAPTTSVLGGTRQMLAEHRMYLSLGTLAVLAALGLHRAFGRRAWIVAAAAALALAVVALHRNADYRSDLAIYTDTVAKRPGNAFAHNNLGKALLNAGRVPEAVAEFRVALRTSTNRVLAHSYLAAALAKLGQVDEAIEHARAAVQLNPRYAEARYNLGTALLRAGQTAAALTELETAVQLQPDYAEAWGNLGAARLQQGNAAEARRAFERAVSLRPDSAAAQRGLGHVLLETGDAPAALPHFEAALRFEPENPEARADLGGALCAVGRAAEAIPHFEAAVRAVPDNAEYHSNLGGALLEGAGRVDDAIAQFELALKLNPDAAETHTNLGIALADRGDRAAALRHLEEAVRLRPDYAFARETLARVRAGQKP